MHLKDRKRARVVDIYRLPVRDLVARLIVQLIAASWQETRSFHSTIQELRHGTHKLFPLRITELLDINFCQLVLDDGDLIPSRRH